jgi:hypothetical protein
VTNLPYTDWNGTLDVYLVRPESSFTSSSVVQGISDHYGVILEVEWEESSCEPQVERVVPLYNKTDVLGLQAFLRDKFAVWTSNSICVEEIWNNFKNIVYEFIEHFVPRKILRKNSDPEYYNKEIKRLKSKVRKTYNRRKLGVHCVQELKQLYKQLFAAKKSAKQAFLTLNLLTTTIVAPPSNACKWQMGFNLAFKGLKSILSKEGKCWSEFYKYVKIRKGNRENVPAIKYCNGRIITDSITKNNSLNFYYSSVFSIEGNIPHIQGETSSEPFTIDTKIIRKRIAAI